MDDLWNKEITLSRVVGLRPDNKGKTDQCRNFVPVLVLWKSVWWPRGDFTQCLKYSSSVIECFNYLVNMTHLSQFRVYSPSNVDRRQRCHNVRDCFASLSANSTIGGCPDQLVENDIYNIRIQFRNLGPNMFLNHCHDLTHNVKMYLEDIRKNALRDM